MKDLLLKIQAQLQVIAGIRNTDIFLSPDADVVPEGVRFPCIGIKDGQVTRSHQMGGVVELELPVEICIYDKLVRDNQSMINVFDLAEQAHAQLRDNLLDAYVKEVEPGRETPVQLLVHTSGMLLRKILYYQYYREE